MTGFAKFIAAAPWTARLGLVIIFGYAIAFLFAPWLAPFGETELVGDTYSRGTTNTSSAPTMSAATCFHA